MPYKDSNSDVRHVAVRALGNIRDSRSVEPLIVALKDEDFQVRGAAAETLGLLKDTHAVEPLIAVLKYDNQVYVRSQAENALKKITGKDFGQETKK